MDEMEDDARYPPNPYPQSNRRLFPSSNCSNLYRSNNFYPSPIPRVNAASDDDGEKEELNNAEEDNPGRGDLRTRNDFDEDDEDCNDDSSENRGKRRRLDGYARGFELVPRSVAPSPLKSSPAEWSEDSAFTLLDARGDSYLQYRRKSISSDERDDVAKKVYRSEAQFRNRLDSLKEYRKEKAKYPDCARSGSKWAYFHKMDLLMSSTSPPPAAQQHTQLPRLPCGIDAGEYVFASSRLSLNRSDGMDEMRDSPGDTGSEEGEEADDESDGLPPRAEKAGGGSESSFRMLANSIQRFGEVYQKMEISKRLQMAELDRMRREFHRDLDLQKRLILDWAQAEVARLRQDDGEEVEEVEERTNEDGSDDDDDDIDVSAGNMNG